MLKWFSLFMLFPSLAGAVTFSVSFDLVGDTGPLVGQHAIGTVVVDPALATDVVDQGGAFLEFFGPLAISLDVDWAGIPYDETHIINDVRLSLHRTTLLPVALDLFGARSDLPSGGDEWFVALSGLGDNLGIYLPGDDLISSFTGTQTGLTTIPEPGTRSLLGMSLCLLLPFLRRHVNVI
jgi:hypothetical protein